MSPSSPPPFLPCVFLFFLHINSPSLLAFCFPSFLFLYCFILFFLHTNPSFLSPPRLLLFFLPFPFNASSFSSISLFLSLPCLSPSLPPFLPVPPLTTSSYTSSIVTPVQGDVLGPPLLTAPTSTILTLLQQLWDWVLFVHLLASTCPCLCPRSSSLMLETQAASRQSVNLHALLTRHRFSGASSEGMPGRGESNYKVRHWSLCLVSDMRQPYGFHHPFVGFACLYIGATFGLLSASHESTLACDLHLIL